ncbi:dihydropyrimidinase [Streptomyces sp. NBC_01803]|uniref:dihydropyrimidinase n=1 Tax=Streptomyces sp. NBC_01803 TaxID=2975946 RepID=UPI002DD9742A|nr:dihydropyrimidinase [Streptomyces sp. NBC_01803]WSA43293.1 dihydropyrimidinase [Streptomyces sp. NBC_01803]
MPHSEPIDLVVRGGTVVNADWQGAADVLVGNGRVRALVAPGAFPSEAIRRAGAGELDASGRLLLPGGVDPHCHVGFTSGEFTSLDDYRQATTAAVFGGTTTIVDFAIPRPGENPADVVAVQRVKAADGLCDSALHACVVDWDDTVPEQLRALVADGVVTVKMFTTYRGETMAEEKTILKVMTHLRDLGGMVVVHCEADHIITDVQERRAAVGAIDAGHHAATRPELAETASVAEILAIAESVAAPVYFVHQSTPEAVDLVARARSRGVRAFTEAVAHHLVLDDSAYAGPHPERFVCCPPLRTATTVAGLRSRVFLGQVATIGSDHCCYDTAQKESARHDVRAMPNGLPGVETRMPVLFSELVVKRGLPLGRFVAALCANPARLNGLYPRKGVIAPGADADFALWDPSVTREVRGSGLHMATDYTPYEGLPVTGWPSTVVVGGRVVVDDGHLTDAAPHGRHIPSGALGPALIC